MRRVRQKIFEVRENIYDRVISVFLFKLSTKHKNKRVDVVAELRKLNTGVCFGSRVIPDDFYEHFPEWMKCFNKKETFDLPVG